MRVKARHSSAPQPRKPAGCQQTSICKLRCRNVWLVTKLPGLCVSVCLEVCVCEKYRTSFVQYVKLVSTQPLLLLRDRCWTRELDGPSHLLNPAGGLSFLLHLIFRPPVHPAGDQYKAPFHQCITNHMQYSAYGIKEVLKMERIPEFLFYHVLNNLQRESLTFSTF